MKAQDLTISVPYQGCDRNCPYCVSKMTWYPDENIGLMEQNFPKVRRFAEAANVTTVLITGKGETLMGDCAVIWYILGQFKDYPVELQTNGRRIASLFKGGSIGLLKSLRTSGLNVIAISVHDTRMFEEYGPLYQQLAELGFVVRVTMNITSLLPKWVTLEYLANTCLEHGVHQLSLRRVVVPDFGVVDTPEAKEVADWIRENEAKDHYAAMVGELYRDKNKRRIRQLPFGARIYDYKGVSVTYFDDCVQTSNQDDDVRSLIFQQDGHLYTSWNSPASILF